MLAEACLENSVANTLQNPIRIIRSLSPSISVLGYVFVLFVVRSFDLHLLTLLMDKSG